MHQVDMGIKCLTQNCSTILLWQKNSFVSLDYVRFSKCLIGGWQICWEGKSYLWKSLASYTYKNTYQNLISRKKNSIIFTEAVLWDTWIHPNVPVESILLASLTVSPQISNTGLVAPITPQTRGPTLMPVTKNPNDFEHNVTLASIIGPDHLESKIFIILEEKNLKSPNHLLFR